MNDDRIGRLQKSFGIIGTSDAIRDIIETVDQVAPTDLSVLIAGESGTGKELVANAIHRHSLRKHYPLVIVNCGAIPAGIIESELFGHVKGSFTGAIEDRKGYFESANRGTIFLDEIGETPFETQVKLLRVLEQGEFLPVGGSKTKRVDTRVIAATNKNLSSEVWEEKFRKDLYYRLKTITIFIPPLRESPEDIPLFVEKFAIEFANRNAIPFKGFSPSAMNILKEYSWPGNIRELKNFIESMIVLQKGEVITSTMVEKRLVIEKSSPSPNLPMRISKSVDQAERELILHQIFLLHREFQEIKDLLLKDMIPTEYKKLPRFEIPQQVPREYKDIHEQEEVIIPEGCIINPELFGDISLEDVERELIEKTLKKFNYRKRQAAKSLKISERTLYRKIKEYEL